MQKHKWYNEIVAWAMGAEIEYRCLTLDNTWSSWMPIDNPKWSISGSDEYRIKPQPKEPQYLYVTSHPQNGSLMLNEFPDYGKFYVGKIKLENDDDNN